LTGTDFGTAKDSPRKVQLGSLQALRAIAALMVVIFHMNVFSLPDRLGSASIWGGFNMGYAGVEIFFVLSGFIMYYIHFRDFGRPERFGRYLSKRVTRIYPFFWLVLVALVTLRTVGGDPFPGWRDIFVSTTLLPFQDSQLLGVQWTLSFEMAFYIIFSIAILNVRVGILVGVVWFSACAVAALTGYSGPGAGFLLSSYNLLFLFGIIAARFWDRLHGGQVPILAFGVILFLSVGLFESVGGYEYYKPLRTVLYGLGAAAIIMSLVSLEASARIRAPRWLVFLGDASFALYLVHVTVMSLAALVLKKLALDDLPPVVLGALLFSVAVAAGAIAHTLVEKPVIAMIRRQTRRNPRQVFDLGD